jgi:hypothetical protein
METSPSTTEITAALLSFHEKALVIGKNSQNPAFKSGPNGGASKYASLAHILEGIAGPLGECGLGFVQFPDGDGLTTRLLHKSGEWMQASLTMRPTQNTPQAHGSAITYAKRYALVAILGLRIDGDDDGNAASAVPSYSAKQLHGWATQFAEAKSKIEVREIWNSLPAEVQPLLKQHSLEAAARIDAAILQAAGTAV